MRTRLREDGYPVDDPTSCSNVLAQGGTSALAFSPDGSLLAAALGDGRVHLFDLANVREVPSPVAKHLDFTFDGSLIAIGGEATHLVVVADVATGEQVYSITDHPGDVTDLEFSEDGSLLLTAGTDGTIRLWDARTGTSALTVPLETSGSIYAGFDPRDPNHIVFAREDGLIGVLTTDTAELLAIARERVLRDFTPRSACDSAWCAVRAERASWPGWMASSVRLHAPGPWPPLRRSPRPRTAAASTARPKRHPGR